MDIVESMWRIGSHSSKACSKDPCLDQIVKRVLETVKHASQDGQTLLLYYARTDHVNILSCSNGRGSDSRVRGTQKTCLMLLCHSANMICGKQAFRRFAIRAAGKLVFFCSASIASLMLFQSWHFDTAFI